MAHNKARSLRIPEKITTQIFVVQGYGPDRQLCVEVTKLKAPKLNVSFS